jgi:hypothetical protein
MKDSLIIFMFLMFATAAAGQIPEKVSKKMGPNPIVFLDSAEIDLEKLNSVKPFHISNIQMLVPKKAKKIIGNKGSDGAIFVTTVKAAKLRNWSYLRAKSSEFAKLILSPSGDTSVDYILNGTPLSDTTAPERLFLVNDKNFRKISIIDKEELTSGNVGEKRYVVSITAKRSKGLVEPSKFR